MSIPGPHRAQLAAFLVAVTGLGSVRLLRHTAEYVEHPGDQSGVEEYEQRFHDLRRAIDGDEVLGYVEEAPTAAPRAASAFDLTRFTLAPLRIVPYPNRPLVVGNFSDPAHEPAPQPGLRLVLLQDFGRGLKLYRNLAP
jgi:hypothetical protein